MKTKLTTFCFLICTMSAFAQIANYDISSYVRPDLKRQTLSLIPDFSIRSSINKSSNVDASLLRFNTGFDLYHTSFVNTTAEQKNISHRVVLNASFGSQKDVLNHYKSLSSSLGRNYSRKKFEAKQKFWEIAYDVGLDYRLYHEKPVNQLDITKKHSLDTELDVAIYRGKGRIEWVTDAWHATTIFEALADYGLLEKVVSKEDIQRFAEVISEIKNTRQTDNRLEQLSEYKQLCTHLIDSDLVNTADYGFFAVLRDAWVYEAIMDRRNGDEFKIGISPKVQIKTESQPNILENPDYLSDLGFDVIVAYNRYQAVSLDWQFNNTNNFITGISFSENLTDRNSIFPSNKYLTNNFNSKWTWHYIPNRRTNYSCGIDFSSSFYQNLEENIFEDFGYFFDIGLMGSYQYYISPRFTWNVEGIINLFASSNNLQKLDFLRNNNRFSFTATYWFY